MCAREVCVYTVCTVVIDDCGRGRARGAARTQLHGGKRKSPSQVLPGTRPGSRTVRLDFETEQYDYTQLYEML